MSVVDQLLANEKEILLKLVCLLIVCEIWFKLNLGAGQSCNIGCGARLLIDFIGCEQIYLLIFASLPHQRKKGHI